MKLGDFSSERRNLLMINPRSSEAERIEFLQLQRHFENKFGGSGFFLIPSSGSSRGKESGAKLIALKADSILNSARRVNRYLQAASSESWVLSLPDHHVAGLGVRARAALTESAVHVIPWDPNSFAARLEAVGAAFLSLVPTQVYDLVMRADRAPTSLRKVFVGGGSLSRDLKRKFAELGWPAVETYGMTETASMIAVREQNAELFRVFPGVEVQSPGGPLQVRCDSLMTASICRVNDSIEINELPAGSWMTTSDRADVVTDAGALWLRLHGRSADYIKINGEGVSLLEVRDLLTESAVALNLSRDSLEIIAVKDERSGHRLALVAEQSVRDLTAAVVAHFNGECRPYEKIQDVRVVEKIPRTELGKLKADDLNRIINEVHGDDV